VRRNRDQVYPISEFLLPVRDSRERRDDQKWAIVSWILQLGEEIRDLHRFGEPHLIAQTYIPVFVP